jgi:hypothetical protein
MKRPRTGSGASLNLDSLVDIVTNMVGILIIIAAFMALLALVGPGRPGPRRETQSAATAPRRVLVPWSHPTHKQTLFFAVRGNRVLFLDLKPFYEQLKAATPGRRGAPVAFAQPGVKVRFFAVTNQLYCLEFTPRPGAGETWADAQRAVSSFRRALARYPRESFVYFFWVAGDSFEGFRDFRQGLWKQQVETGWKPVLTDAPLEVCNGFEGSNTFQPQ